MTLSDQFKGLQFDQDMSDEQMLFQALKPLMRDEPSKNIIERIIGVLVNHLGHNATAHERALSNFADQILGKILSPLNTDLQRIVMDGLQSPHDQSMDDMLDDDIEPLPKEYLNMFSELETQYVVDRIDCLVCGLTDKLEEEIKDDLDQTVGLNDIYHMIRDMVEISFLNEDVMHRYTKALPEHVHESDLSGFSNDQKLNAIRYLIAESVVNIVHDVVRNAILDQIIETTQVDSYFSCRDLFTCSALD